MGVTRNYGHAPTWGSTIGPVLGANAYLGTVRTLISELRLYAAESSAWCVSARRLRLTAAEREGTTLKDFKKTCLKNG